MQILNKLNLQNTKLYFYVSGVPPSSPPYLILCLYGLKYRFFFNFRRIYNFSSPPHTHSKKIEKYALHSTKTRFKSEKFLMLRMWKTRKSSYIAKIRKHFTLDKLVVRVRGMCRDISSERYRKAVTM